MSVDYIIKDTCVKHVFIVTIIQLITCGETAVLNHHLLILW
jgi:hypothetical protein